MTLRVGWRVLVLGSVLGSLSVITPRAAETAIALVDVAQHAAEG